MNGGSLTMTGVEVRNNQVRPCLLAGAFAAASRKSRSSGPWYLGAECWRQLSAGAIGPRSFMGSASRHNHTLAAHRAQNFSKRCRRHRNHRAARQRLHDHVLFRVPEQNCDTVRPSESGCKQPVQIKQLTAQRTAAICSRSGLSFNASFTEL